MYIYTHIHTHMKLKRGQKGSMCTVLPCLHKRPPRRPSQGPSPLAPTWRPPPPAHCLPPLWPWALGCPRGQVPSAPPLGQGLIPCHPTQELFKGGGAFSGACIIILASSSLRSMFAVVFCKQYKKNLSVRVSLFLSQDFVSFCSKIKFQFQWEHI